MITHHCDECGEHVEDFCPTHPRARINSIIEIPPDEPAKIADRLARRLVKEKLINAPTHGPGTLAYFNRIVEALADELHQDIIDRMLGGAR